MVSRFWASLLAMALLGTAEAVLAAPKATAGSELPLQCFVAAGQRYRVDPMLLYAIAEVESNLIPSATNRNRNGSVDYGLMQVNSLHLPKLKSIGIDERRLLDDPCVSVHAGASILAEMIARYGYTWAAVGAYNAGGSAARGVARHQYATKVWQRYSAMVSTRERAMARGRGVNEAAGRRHKKLNTIVLQNGSEEPT
ncbi:lytic transglycosylase domain-containing protein [Pandoraea fibrosis]|nr:lytic transglycosylase domain-containing protein [Pandoraea fibrosis]